MNSLTKGLFLFLVFGSALLQAETFVDSEIGVSISTPDGWKHVPDEEQPPFGYLIEDAKDPKAGKIRLHLANPKATSPEEAMKSSAAKLQENHNPQRPLPPDEIIFSKPVVTASGLKGYMGSFGTKYANGSTFISINHYYFQRPDGIVFCACAYVHGNAQLAETCEKIILGTLQLTGDSNFPSKEQKASYVGEGFFAPKMTLSIYALSARKPARDSFVQLLEQPDKRVVTSLHWPQAHHISALWNPDSRLVAINYQVEDQISKMKVFRVSTAGLTEIALPKSLSLKKILPKNSPEFVTEEWSAGSWKNDEELQCVVMGTPKNPQTEKKRSGAAPANDGNISYDVLISFSGKEAAVISSQPAENKTK